MASSGFSRERLWLERLPACQFWKGVLVLWAVGLCNESNIDRDFKNNVIKNYFFLFVFHLLLVFKRLCKGTTTADPILCLIFHTITFSFCIYIIYFKGNSASSWFNEKSIEGNFTVHFTVFSLLEMSHTF